MNWEKELLELFDDPLFAGIVPPPPKVTADGRLVESFEEINKWIEANGHTPSASGNFKEKLLAARLDGIRANEKKREALLPLDKHEILKK